MGRRRRLRALLLVLVAALAVAIGLVSYGTDLFQTLELSTVDARFSVRGIEKPPSDLVVVGVNADTLKLNEQWPFPRSFHARVIDRLRADGAKVIAFDVVFAEPSRERPKLCRFFGADFPRRLRAHRVLRAGGQRRVLGHRGAARARQDPPRPDGRPLLRSEGARWLHGHRRRRGRQRAPLPVRLQRAQELRRGGGRARDREAGAALDLHRRRHRLDRLLRAARHDPRGPYWKVYEGQTPPGYFRGKTVVVGATDPTLKDVFHTATSGDQLMSGPELQANAIGTVRRGNPLREASTGVDVLLIVLLGLAAPLASLRLRLWGLLVALGFAVAFLVGAQLAFNGGKIVAFVYPLLALMVGAVGSLVVQYFTETRERQRACATVLALRAGERGGPGARQADDDLRLGGVQREGTVMFSDLRGFTTFAESLPVERVIEVLNLYLGEMSDAILDHGGTLVAYMGDGIMAVFGAPIEQPDHADRALAAAREMLGPRLERFNAWLRDEGLGEGFRMGVGLNSGHGDVGQRRLGAAARVHGDRRHHQHRRAARGHDQGHAAPAVRVRRDALVPARGADDLVYVGEFEVRGRTQKITLWSIEDSGRLPASGRAARTEHAAVHGMLLRVRAVAAIAS